MNKLIGERANLYRKASPTGPYDRGSDPLGERLATFPVRSAVQVADLSSPYSPTLVELDFSHLSQTGRVATAHPLEERPSQAGFTHTPLFPMSATKCSQCGARKGPLRDSWPDFPGRLELRPLGTASGSATRAHESGRFRLVKAAEGFRG